MSKTIPIFIREPIDRSHPEVLLIFDTVTTVMKVLPPQFQDHAKYKSDLILPK